MGTKPGIHKLLAAGSSLAGERAKPPGGETGHKLKLARLNPVFAHRIFDYHTFSPPSGKKERGGHKSCVIYSVPFPLNSLGPFRFLPSEETGLLRGDKSMQETPST